VTQHLELCEDAIIKKVKLAIFVQEDKDIYQKTLARRELSSFLVEQQTLI
jgi:hypothetical protein